MTTPPPSAPDQQPVGGTPQPSDPAQQPPAFGQQPPAFGQQPPAFGQQPPAYGQPAYGAPAPVMSNLTLNLWLSVFFVWIPALIFYLIEKDKVPALSAKANADNFNFQLIRTIVIVASGVLVVVPVLNVLLGLASLALFIIAIVHAVQVPQQVAAGQPGKFILTPAWIK